MTDIDYGELFGLDLSENNQEVAEPETESKTEPQSENNQETAEPDGDAIDEPAEEGQSKEENSKYAAIRRKAERERDEAIAKAREESRIESEKILDEQIKSMRMTNPYTQKPITSKKEYDEYLETRSEERTKANRRRLNMDEEEYSEFVNSLPEVQEAKAEREKAEQAKKQAQDIEIKAKIDEQIKNISMLDPSIKSIDDLRKMDNYQDLFNKVNKGYSIEDAFKLVNFDRLLKTKQDTSVQQTLNNMQSKSHMTTTKARGTGSLAVPPDVKAQYLELNPGITDAEITAHYNRYHNS